MRIEFEDLAAGVGGQSMKNPASGTPQPGVAEDRARPLPVPPNQLTEVAKVYREETGYGNEATRGGEHFLPKKPLWMRGVMFVCGIENMETEEKQKAKEEAERLKNSPEYRLNAMRDSLAAIIESDGMRRACTINALALLTVGVFIWAYLM